MSYANDAVKIKEGGAIMVFEAVKIIKKMEKPKKVESTLRFRNDDFRRKSFKFRHVESIVLATFFKGNKEDGKEVLTGE